MLDVPGSVQQRLDDLDAGRALAVAAQERVEELGPHGQRGYGAPPAAGLELAARPAGARAVAGDLVPRSGGEDFGEPRSQRVGLPSALQVAVGGEVVAARRGVLGGVVQGRLQVGAVRQRLADQIAGRHGVSGAFGGPRRDERDDGLGALAPSLRPQRLHQRVD